MAQYQEGAQRPASRERGQGRTAESVSPWVTGFTVFAGIMLIAIGSAHFIAGLAAVLDDTFYVVGSNYTMRFDVTTWGWIQMVAGIVVGLAGAGVIAGNSVTARVIAVLVAGASLIWSFYSIPYYPVWSILIIALDVAVIWALVAHGGETDLQAR